MTFEETAGLVVYAIFMAYVWGSILIDQWKGRP